MLHIDDSTTRLTVNGVELKFELKKYLADLFMLLMSKNTILSINQLIPL